MPQLYLIPSPVSRLFQLPVELKELRHFVVENLREARRFLKWNFPALPLDECQFLEINQKETDTAGIRPFLLKALKNNADVGLLSDAGLPCVADPGAVVVEKAHELGFTVRPLSGPSSILLALMASGFNGQCFAFHGYLPIPEPEQIKAIRKLEEESVARNMTQIFIETPYRNNKLLQQLIKTLKPQTRLCVACDLDSESEEIVSQSIQHWKKENRNFHKRPAVFLIYAR